MSIFENNRVCPFLTNHVTSTGHYGEPFSNSCDGNAYQRDIDIHCVYSEANWDGGVVFIECIKERCIYWSPCCDRSLYDEYDDYVDYNVIPEEQWNCIFKCGLNNIVALTHSISQKIREYSEDDTLGSLAGLLKIIIELLEDGGTDGIMELLTLVLGDKNDTGGQSIHKILKHVHDNHGHQNRHIATSFPSTPGWPAGMDEATKKVQEWLLQLDVDGDGEIYGPPPTCGGIPVLNALKNHPEWDCNWVEDEDGN